MEDYESPRTPLPKFWQKTLQDKVYESDDEWVLSEKSWMKP